MARIMIADDSELEANVTRKMLIQLGHDCVMTSNYQETIDRFDNEIYDILLIDVLMTGKDGIDILKEIKEKYPKIKAVLISSLPEEELAKLAEVNKADGYIQKPFTSSELKQHIEDIMNG